MKIKVLSFNIQNGFTAKYDYAMLGRDIAAEDADLIGLQEVDRFTNRNGKRHSLKEIADAAGYKHCAFARAIDYSDGQYGTAILSKYPIKSFNVLPLESHGEEQRSAGIAEIEIGGKDFLFVNTHLSLGGKEMRAEQFETLAELVKDRKYYFITGDFNTEDFSEFEPIKGAMLTNREDNKLCSYKTSQIDNIVCPASFKLVSSFVRNEVEHSDHYMLGASFEV